MKVNISAGIEKITPEIATEWLQNVWEEQRVIRPGHVKRLVADMIAGRFHIAPDCILRVKGSVMNGQHRLRAVVESGKAQQFVVMESNDEELYKVIDAGLKRTLADGLKGHQYAGKIPSVARWVRAYESGHFSRSAEHPSHADLNPGDIAPTQIEQINYCRDNEERLSAAVAFVSPLYMETKLLALSIGSAIHAIAAAGTNGKSEKAKDFLKQVYVDGGNTAAGDLRNRLISNKGAKARLPNGYIFGITLKSFQSFCNGTRATRLRWDKTEEMPQI